VIFGVSPGLALVSGASACCRFVYFSVITGDVMLEAFSLYLSASKLPLAAAAELFRPHQRSSSLLSLSIFFKMLIDFQIKLSAAPMYLVYLVSERRFYRRNYLQVTFPINALLSAGERKITCTFCIKRCAEIKFL